MSFKINPCKACWKKYENGDCNINTVNSCVTATAAAFAGIPSNNYIRDTPADTNWEECMEKMMKSQGRTPCDFQLDMAPVWNQVPHHFPTLLAEQGNPKNALDKCLQLCGENRLHKNECAQNCTTDFNAIESYVHPTRKNSPKPEHQKKIKLGVWISVITSVVLLMLLAFLIYKYKT